MKTTVLLVLAALILVGCKASDQPQPEVGRKPQEMPGGIGLSSGQGGTGATTG